jgi:hypothetical protein
MIACASNQAKISSVDKCKPMNMHSSEMKKGDFSSEMASAVKRSQAKARSDAHLRELFDELVLEDYKDATNEVLVKLCNRVADKPAHFKQVIELESQKTLNQHDTFEIIKYLEKPCSRVKSAEHSQIFEVSNHDESWENLSQKVSIQLEEMPVAVEGILSPELIANPSNLDLELHASHLGAGHHFEISCMLEDIPEEYGIMNNDANSLPSAAGFCGTYPHNRNDLDAGVRNTTQLLPAFGAELHKYYWPTEPETPTDQIAKPTKRPLAPKPPISAPHLVVNGRVCSEEEVSGLVTSRNPPRKDSVQNLLLCEKAHIPIAANQVPGSIKTDYLERNTLEIGCKGGLSKEINCTGFDCEPISPDLKRLMPNKPLATNQTQDV